MHTTDEDFPRYVGQGVNVGTLEDLERFKSENRQENDKWEDSYNGRNYD